MPTLDKDLSEVQMGTEGRMEASPWHSHQTAGIPVGSMGLRRGSWLRVGVAAHMHLIITVLLLLFSFFSFHPPKKC